MNIRSTVCTLANQLHHNGAMTLSQAFTLAWELAKNPADYARVTFRKKDDTITSKTFALSSLRKNAAGNMLFHSLNDDAFRSCVPSRVIMIDAVVSNALTVEFERKNRIIAENMRHELLIAA